ncbi:MAG: hypothetical protein M8865_07860 [marine benthic group bacterium]|jgi:hypothetical protein|nr:hypothetical protein [Gemmatimonadota bacterium]
MRRVLTFLTAIALIAATGCDRQPVEPVPEAGGDAVTFNFNNNPDGGSLNIYRTERDAFFVLFDPESTLAAVLSSTPDCGGFLEPADMQRVVKDPYDVVNSQVRELMIADPINIFIVDLATGGGCFGYGLVATGAGKLVSNDNDLYAFFRENRNANAFGFGAHGKVVDTSGRKWHFNGHNRFVWDGQDFATLKATEQFNLRPTGK